MGIAERRKTTKFYHNLVFAKIKGMISQAELERRLNNMSSTTLDRKTQAAGEKPEEVA